MINIKRQYGQVGRWADGQWVFSYLPTCRPADLPLLYLCVLVVSFLCLAGVAPAQDVLGQHDLSLAGTSPTKGSLSGSCLYCHAPHSGLNGAAGVSPTPLWNTKLSSVASYTVYNATTLVNNLNPSPPLGTDTTLCLSCHDGTVGGSPGATVAYGTVQMLGQMNPNDVFGSDLSTMHPVSFVLSNGHLNCFPSAQPSVCANSPSTNNPAVPLINGNVECTSCHNAHVQNTDPTGNFLVVDNSSSALCNACHNTTMSGTGMGLNNVQVSRNTTSASKSQLTATAAGNNTNPLASWATSVHATAANKVSPQIILAANAAISTTTVHSQKRASLGPYRTVAMNGCESCHAQHNAAGQKSLLRAVDDLACLNCHNGSSNISPATSNILAEMVAPKYGHAFSVGNTPHLAGEPVLVNQNFHVTCADCHNPHSTGKVAQFPAAPGIRNSQNLVQGVSATDGKTVVSPAVNQYENCLRCHGTSTGKRTSVNLGYMPTREVAASDTMNVIPEFSSLATSSHPVFFDRHSMFPQPSLRYNLLNLDGKTLGRSMGTRILCTDCHNSDDNREFGGAGPSGPHGSIFPHIMERRYEFSQAPIPGQLVTNLFPYPDLSAQGGTSGGPYALCAKCHDLNQVMNNTSFSEHARHVKQDGFSCSVCHTGHGMGAQSGSVSGERLVNFDVRVVAPNGGAPISYSHATNSCSLVCHNHPHQLLSASGAAKH
jgi:predicted CXXCH cytochrome family protein